MSQRQVRQWRVAIILGMLLLSGCGSASPTPIVIAPAPTLTPLPPIPTAALPEATDAPTDIPATAATALTTTALTATDLTTTAEGTATLGTVPATGNPIDQPFLMKIDKF